MKKLNFGLCFLLLLAAGFASCSSDGSQQYSTTGQISLRITPDKTVKDARTADVALPDAADFSVVLTSGTGEEIPLTGSSMTVPVGRYTVSAAYGDKNAEGFDALSYAGSAEALVTKNETTEVSVLCTIDKALVSIDYTDEFKEYFSSYSAFVTSSAGNRINYAADETRAAYFVPGELKVSLNVVKDGTDKTITLQPKTVAAEVRHEYRLTMDVDASTAKLTVIFNEQPQHTENVTIDVSDAALNAPAPVLTPHGFVSGETIEYIEGNAPTNDNANKFDVYLNAQGGISSFDLTAQSTYWEGKGYPAQTDLASLNTSYKYSMTLTGLKGNIGKIASVDFTSLLKSLVCSGEADEEHSFTFSATDKLSKMSEPVVVKVKTLYNQFDASPVGVARFGDSQVQMKVKLLGVSDENDLKSKLGFRYAAGDDWKYVSTSKASAVKATEDNTWDVTLTLPVAFEESGISVKVTCGAREKVLAYTGTTADVSLSISNDADIWATKVVCQVAPSGTGAVSAIDPATVKFQYLDNNTWKDFDDAAVSYEADYGYTVTGLTGNTAYTVRASCLSGEETLYSNAVTVTMEEKLQVENGDFETWSSAMVWEHTIVFSGGEKIYSYYPYGSSETDSWWNTLNGITTQSQSGVASWYYVAYPGTMPTNASEVHTAIWHLNNHDGKSYSEGAYRGSAAAEIATVGYGVNRWTGTPASTQHRQAGQLYIGTFNDNTPELGHSFASRPSSVGFYFKFYSYENETTQAYAQVFDADKNVIGEGTFHVSVGVDDYTYGEIPITYTERRKKAASITIVFMSTDAASPATKSIQGSKGAWQAGFGDSRHIGSIFTVDDVTLNY